MSLRTPNRSFVTMAQPNNSLALEHSLVLQRNRKIVKKSLIWGSVNAGILAVLLYDISNSCPLYLHYYDYLEYFLALVVGLNLLYYCAKIVISSFAYEQIPVTLEQKKLLGISDTDPNFKIVDNLMQLPPQSPILRSFMGNTNTPSPPLSSTPMNMSALSWRSNLSQNESLNYSMSSPSWSYQKVNPDPGSPYNNPENSFNSIQFRDTSGVEFIADDVDLDKYLKEFETNTSAKNLSNPTPQTSNLLSSFWSHPVTKTAKDVSLILRKCSYQLSTPSQSSSATSSPKGKGEDKISPQSPSDTSALVAWTRMNVDIATLTQWNENLRKWISQTILDRLVREFDRVDEALDKQGLSDIKVGSVGLDRLRKTAQMAQIIQYVPSLSTLISFLEVTPNQEYLVKRIRELAKGGCMSEFRWKSGSSYNGKDWDESLPTDAAIIMHLLASYLDTQLMPLPSMPDVKPFSGLHYIKSKDKVPILTPNSLYIQQVSEKPPHFRVIVGETIYEMVKGYSNLLHSILFFLYHVNKREHGMLGRVNLGRAGVNMLWIIEQGQ